MNVSGSTGTVTAPTHTYTAAGTFTVTTTVANTDGTSLVTTQTVVVPPLAVTHISPSSGPETGGTTVTVTGSGFTGATKVTFGTGVGKNLTVVNDTTLTVVSPSQVPGVYPIQVTTPAGKSPAVPADKFTAIGPVITSLSPTSGLEAGGTSVTITGSGFTGATKVVFGTVVQKTLTVVNDTTITVASPAQAPGTVALRVTTPDGTSALVAADQFTYLGPSITGISPASGPKTGATSVTITGSGFTGATKVAFGTVAATSFTVVNDTTITATSPVESPATVNIKVTTPDGVSPSVAADQFTYLGPVVTAISPTSGPIAGGATVTVTGSGFTGATKVAFGTLAGQNLDVVNDHTILVTSPAEGPGTVAIRVTTPDGQSAAVTADLYTYVGPVLTSISPTSGPMTGGTTVTVTGSGFTGATEVTFGSVAGKNLTVVNDTTITVTSPAESPATVAVRVVTPNGSSATVSGDQFTFIGPVVTAISPTGGTTAGGTTVTVTGSGFTGATKVAFGTLAGKNLTVVNDHTITVTSPAEAAGTVAIRVTTPNGLSAPVTADLFTYS